MPVPKVIVRENSDGSFSSEITRSVSHAALNKGRETLIPTLIEGVEYPVGEATRRAIKSGLVYPDFDTPELATAHAAERSRTGGATAHGFLGKERKMPKKTGIKERASRQVAFDTAAAKPGAATTLKRGVAMIGALVTSAFAPGDTKSDAEIRERRSTGRKAAAKKKAAKKKSAMERGKPVRDKAEGILPGDPARKLEIIARAAKK